MITFTSGYIFTYEVIFVNVVSQMEAIFSTFVIAKEVIKDFVRI